MHPLSVSCYQNLLSLTSCCVLSLQFSLVLIHESTTRWKSAINFKQLSSLMCAWCSWRGREERWGKEFNRFVSWMWNFTTFEHVVHRHSSQWIDIRSTRMQQMDRANEQAEKKPQKRIQVESLINSIALNMLGLQSSMNKKKKSQLKSHKKTLTHSVSISKKPILFFLDGEKEIE